MNSLFLRIFMLTILFTLSTVTAKSTIKFKIPKAVIAALKKLKSSVEKYEKENGGNSPLSGDLEEDMPLNSEIEPYARTSPSSYVFPLNKRLIDAQNLQSFNRGQYYNGGLHNALPLRDAISVKTAPLSGAQQYINALPYRNELPYNNALLNRAQSISGSESLNSGSSFSSGDDRTLHRDVSYDGYPFNDPQLYNGGVPLSELLTYGVQVSGAQHRG